MINPLGPTETSEIIVGRILGVTPEQINIIKWEMAGAISEALNRGNDYVVNGKVLATPENSGVSENVTPEYIYSQLPTIYGK